MSKRHRSRSLSAPDVDLDSRENWLPQFFPRVACPPWLYLAINVFEDNDPRYVAMLTNRKVIQQVPGPFISIFLDHAVTRYGKYIYEEIFCAWKNLEPFSKQVSPAEFWTRLANRDIFDDRITKLTFLFDQKWATVSDMIFAATMTEADDQILHTARKQVFGLDDYARIVDWTAPFWSWYKVKFAKNYLLSKEKGWSEVDIPLRFAPCLVTSDWINDRVDQARDPFGEKPMWKDVHFKSRWLGYQDDETEYFDSGRQIPGVPKHYFDVYYMSQEVHRRKLTPFHTWASKFDHEDLEGMQRCLSLVRCGEVGEVIPALTRGRTQADPESLEGGVGADWDSEPDEDDEDADNFEMADTQSHPVAIEAYEEGLAKSMKKRDFWRALGPDYWLGVPDNIAVVLDASQLCQASLPSEDTAWLDQANLETASMSFSSPADFANSGFLYFGPPRYGMDGRPMADPKYCLFDIYTDPDTGTRWDPILMWDRRIGKRIKIANYHEPAEDATPEEIYAWTFATYYRAPDTSVKRVLESVYRYASGIGLVDDH